MQQSLEDPYNAINDTIELLARENQDENISF